MKTIIDLFETSVSKFPSHSFLLEKQHEKYQSTTYKTVHQEVLEISAGLIASGIKKGDRIALLSEGRNQWLISELGILYAGAINVPLSVKLDPESELLFRLKHSECRMIFVSESHYSKILQISDQLPFLEKIICLDKISESSNQINYSTIRTRGIEYLKNNLEKVQQTYKNVLPDDLANISYTSGTTADPKGIMLSHLNYTANVIQANTLMNITDDWKTLAFLPWDHAFAHTACLYCLMINGAAIASLENGKTPFETLKNIPKNIKEVEPHLLMSVPAVAKNFRKGIESGIHKKGEKAEKLFKLALKTAYRYNGNGYNKGKGFRIIYKPAYKLFDRILFSKIRQGFGKNLKLFIGGGALLDIELQRFFFAIGIPMCQGYGLSEASPVISSNAINAIKFGSSGKIVKYMELKIVDDQNNEMPSGEKGEIIIKGDNVMKGYWKNETATAETIIDGWLHTGDMGYVDKDGFLYVLGRFKSLLIGNDGEKFSPEGIEEALVENSGLIDQCILINNQNPYTGCLLVPNISNLKTLLKKEKRSSSSEEAIDFCLEKFQQAIDAYKANGKFANLFPERWIPSATIILPEAFSEENQLLNSTMKKVRGKITDYFANEVQLLFQPENKKMQNSINRTNLAQWLTKKE